MKGLSTVLALSVSLAGIGLAPCVFASDDIDALKKALSDIREKEPTRHQDFFAAEVRYFYALENADYHALAQRADALVGELQGDIQGLVTDLPIDHASQIPAQTALSRAYLYRERTQDLSESVREIESSFVGRCGAERLEKVRAHFDPLRHLTLEQVPDQTMVNYQIGISVGFNEAGVNGGQVSTSGETLFVAGAATAGAACLLLPPPASVACYAGVVAFGALATLRSAVVRKQESAELLRKIYNAKIDAYLQAAASTRDSILPICESTLKDVRSSIQSWSADLQLRLDGLRSEAQKKVETLEVLARAMDDQVTGDLERWCSLSWEQVGVELAQRDQAAARGEAQEIAQTLDEITERFVAPSPLGAERLADDWIHFHTTRLGGHEIYPLHPLEPTFTGGAL